MTLQAQIEVLESLAALDAELFSLTAELETERDAFDGKKSQLAELEAKLDATTQSVHEMERVRNELMHEVRQMSLQIDKSREKLSRVRTEREANAAQRELEELRKLYRDRETEIEKLAGLIEQAKVETESTAEQKSALNQEVGASENDVTSHLGEVQQQMAAKQSSRQALVAKLPPVIYRRYEMIRKRRNTAIASTTDGTCSECHMLLPPMLYQTLTRAQELAQCPSCNRILYFRAATPAESLETQDTTSGP
ncbi:MAG: C4-type zinc ribbon domain-containing protein [Polyangiaceae bacterium]